MNLQEEILSVHSKNQALTIANYIGADEERFAELMQLFLRGNYRLTQCAAWIVNECATNYPFLIIDYLPMLIEKLKEAAIHDAVKRNVVRIWAMIDLPIELHGEIYELCFNFLLSSREAIAVKVFSMSTLQHIAIQNPELKAELGYAIEDQLLKFDNSPAILSRGKKILKSLGKK